VWCKRGWGYLFGVIDAFDREIVGWAFSLRCTTDILLEAVDMALNYRPSPWDLREISPHKEITSPEKPPLSRRATCREVSAGSLNKWISLFPLNH